MPVQVSAIADQDVPRVASFLHSAMDGRVPADAWARLLDVPWGFEQPNCGFMLLDGEEVVGAYLAYYSERDLGAGGEGFCNLGSWCVLPQYRLHSLRLLKALLAQEGYRFTDFTPDATVIELNLRLGFRWLEGPAALVPDLPWPTPRGGRLVSSDPATIERTLQGAELGVYRDHGGVDRVRSVVLAEDLGGEGRRCHVVLRRERRFGLPVALLLHVSDPGLLTAMARPFARHLLLRHRTVAHLLEARIAGPPPRLRLGVSAPRRMLHGGGADAARIDYLYSELARLAW